MEHGFFYVKNHGIPEELMEGVFRESKRFFNLPLEDKMDSLHRDFLGYTPLYAEKLDTSLTTIGFAHVFTFCIWLSEQSGSLDLSFMGFETITKQLVYIFLGSLGTKLINN